MKFRKKAKADVDAALKYKGLRKLCKKELRRLEKVHIEGISVALETNPKRFFQFFKQKSSTLWETESVSTENLLLKHKRKQMRLLCIFCPSSVKLKASTT